MTRIFIQSAAPWVLVILLGCRPSGGERVVLITLDTLRWDSFAGSMDRPTAMPELAAWSRDAVVFERFYSASSSTQPTHASMLTGLHPWQHGVARNGIRLAPERLTVTEILSQAGYSTAAVVASLPVAGVFGFDQGFDRFIDDFDLGDLERPYWRQAATRAVVQGGAAELQAPAAEEPFYSLASKVVERAVAELDAFDAEGRQRQFLWVHLFDPHSPYGDAVEGSARSHPGAVHGAVAKGRDPWPVIAQARRLYDVDVGALDKALAVLLERLERDGERLRTHVVVVSDHGESFGEDGSMAHSRRLTLPQIHVPLVILSPTLESGTRRDVAGSVDIAPTLLTLAGVERELPAGRDLTVQRGPRPHALGMRRPFDQPVPDPRIDGSAPMLPERWFFWVDEDGKLYRGNAETLEGPSISGSSADSAGAEDVPPNLQQRLLALFTAFEKELAAGASGEAIERPEVVEALRALGYVE